MATKKKPQPAYLTQPAPDANWSAFDNFVFQQPAPAPDAAESSGVMRRALGDTGISLLKGAIGVPEAALGVADLVTGGGAGRMAEAAGFRPKEAKAYLDEFLSPEQQAANREVQQADGFMGKMGAAITNPSVIGQAVLESLPAMGGGAVVARGALALAPRMGAVAAGAGGEGVVSAGQTAEQIRQETPGGTLSGTQVALAAGSGALTGALGILGGKVAQSLGIGDVDTMLAQASRATGAQAAAAEAVKKGVVRRVLEGVVSEGVLEELPQSLQEQVAQNVALGKPVDEGLDYAAVLGLLSGGLMGGAAAGLSKPGPAMTPGDDIRAAGLQEERGPMTRALNAAVEAGAQKADAGVPVPTEPGTAPVTGAMAPADPTATGSAAEGAGAPPAAPAIDFEAVLARIEAQGAADVAGLRDFSNRGAAPAVPQQPATITGGPAPVQQPAPDVLNSKGEPFKNQRAAVTARARQADPGAFDIVQVEGGWVVRPTQGFTSDGLQPEGDAPAGAADGTAVPGDRSVAQQPAIAPGTGADASAPVASPAPGGDAAGAGPGGAVPADALAAQQAPTLPKELAGAKPRYSYGPKQFDLTFASDLDKAAYVIAQDKASSRDAEYLDFVMKATGLDEAGARAMGRKVRDRIKGMAKQSEAGPLVVPIAEATDVPTEPINAAAPGTTAGSSIGVPPESSTPEAAAPTTVHVDSDNATHWNALLPKDRVDVLTRAGWAGGGQSKSAQRLLNVPWDKLSDSQRTRIGAALQPNYSAATDNPAAMVSPSSTGAEGGTGETPGSDRPETPSVSPTADQKARWLKAVADAHRLAGNTGVQIGGMVNGRLNFLGDPNATKQGRSLLASVEEARKAGATDAEIAAAVVPQAAPAPAADDRPALFDEMKQRLSALAERAMEAHDGRLSGQIRGFTVGMSNKDNLLTREWVEQVVAERERMVKRAERQAGISSAPAAPKKPNKATAKADERAAQNQQPPTTTPPPRSVSDRIGPIHLWWGVGGNNGQSDALTEEGRKQALRAIGRDEASVANAVGVHWNFQRGEIKQKLTALRESGWTPDRAAPANPDQSIGQGTPNPVAKVVQPSTNTVFTEDAAAAARARLKAKLGRLSSGIDPETLMDGITLAGYHIEKGARTFAAYARAMVDDLGDAVKPYLQSWYMAVRADPRAAAFKADMDKASAVEDVDVDQVLADSVPTAPAEQAQNAPQEAADGSPAQSDQLPDANPPADQPAAAAGNGDRQSLDAGVAGTSEDAAGSGRVPASPEGPGAAGAGGVQPGDGKAPRAPRDRAGVGPEPGAADDFDLTGEDIGTGGLTRKYRDNIAAIQIIKALEAEGRKSTADERKKLARYVGWGALKGVFDHANKQWAKEYAELKGLLTEAEWQAAAASVRNAHYTSPVVVKGIINVLERLGVTKGRMLEPSVGTGNFFGFMPDRLRKAAQLFGVELDPITAKIAAGLYPSANVKNIGFEDFDVPGGYFDVAFGNPPFGNEPIRDLERSPYSGFSIHNYFFAKTIDKLRPGGVMTMVVSHNFLDSLDAKTRLWIQERADLIGAARLPRTAFKENAGTEVVTDVVVFQKRAEGQQAAPAFWVEVGKQTNANAKTGEDVEHRVNRYFLDNPQNILGTPSASGTMYGPNEYTVEPSGDLEKQLAGWIETLPEGIYQPIDRTEKMHADEVPDGVKVGSYFVAADGSIKVRGPDEVGVRTALPYAPASDKAAERVKGMVGLRDALRNQMRLERSTTSTEAEIEAGRASLNGLYDKFQKAYGYLNDPTNRRLFLDDTEANLLLALEFDYDKGVSAAVAEREGIDARKPSANKADIFKRRVLFPPQDDIRVENARDALLTSLNFKGGIDLPYMERLYGKKAAAIVEELGDLVFATPDGGVVTADEYLSGDVKTKLADAETAARTDAAMKRNVEALRKVIPVDKKPSEIHAAPGAKFVPAAMLQDFAKRISGADVEARYVKNLGQWFIVERSNGDPVLNRAKWGTADVSALDILASTIAGKTVIVTRTHRNPDGTTTTTVDEKATEAARNKQSAMKEDWQTWLWADPERAQKLVEIYNDEMNRWVERKYDGSHLTLPGKVPDDVLALLGHQKAGVWRALQSRQILLDHVVGAGKTFQMVAIAMELRRMGIARKPFFAVPNHLTLQWRSEFARMYPGANVLAATPEDFAKGNRERFFSKIITGDWDAVIVGHSSLKKIALPPETEKAILQEQVQELADAIEEMKRSRGDKRIVSDMQGIKKRLEAKLKDKLAGLGKRDKVVTFDELGVDAMFVDELHEFKNLYYNSTMDRVPGMGNPAGSDKAFDLFVKMQWLFNMLGDQAPIVGATGTPVSNSLVEMFNMQRFMQYPTMKAEGLHVFDAWARQFGSVENVYEVAPSGTGYRSSNRFSKFKNLPALMAHYQAFADVVTLDDLKAQEEQRGKKFPVPKIRGGRPTIVVAERSPLVADFMGVPHLEMDGDRVQFGFNPLAGEAIDITEDKDGFFIQRVLAKEDGTEVRLLVGRTKTRAEADMKVVEAGLSPKITVDPNSILGKFGRLKELKRQTKGKVNALSLTGAANKAGLDYRLIDPAAPDFPGSKINKAVDNIMAEYHRWTADKGTQLVFCDLSVPLSERSGFASKARRLYVREAGAVVHKKGTMHTVEGHEDLPFFVVQTGTGPTKRFELYDAASGLLLRGGDSAPSSKADAVALATEAIKDEAKRQRWIDARESTGEITQDLIDDYNDANEIDTEETESITLQDVAGISGASKFSVYDDIKAKLIRKGIPEHEIAFIHDYGTPTAKQKLFNGVNRGSVRVLLGSTPKMGAGTNVQKLLVAEHHIDAPWRPSDLEQREGRIIRRGNSLYERDPENFDVGIYRYATQQTYDTRRWQILEHKARGIEQLRNYDGTTNEIDDIDGEASNAADMKAAASGDPLILKETQLRNEVKRLETLAAGHVDAVQDMRRRAKWADDWLAKSAPRELKTLTDQIEKANQHPVPEEGMPTGSAIDGEAIADKKAYTQALARKVAEAVTAGDSDFRFSYRGLSFRFHPDAKFGSRLYPGDSEYMSIASWGPTEAISATGIVQRLQNYVERLPGLVAEHNAKVKQQTEEAAGMRAEAAKPFPEAALLEKTREKHKRVQRLLIARGPEVPADEKPILETAQEQQKEALREAGFGDALDELLAFKEATDENLDDEPAPERENIAQTGAAAGNTTDVVFQRGAGGGLSLEAAQAMADDLKAQGVKGLHVAATVADLPPRQRWEVLARDPSGKVRGAYFRRGDQVWMVAENLRGADDFVRVALHEAFHRGIAKTVPNSLALLRQLRIQNQALRAATAEQMKRHGIGQDEAIEEALADMAGDGRIRELKGFEKFMAALREWARKIGRALGLGTATLTDDDLMAFIRNTTRAGLTAGVGVTVNVDSGPSLSRNSARERAKELGLPATGPTARMERMVSIAEADPRTWTREDFDLIAPHLSVHQDLRPDASSRVQQILAEGLRSGMVDSVDAMTSGKSWTWAHSLQGVPAYVFVSGRLKYLSSTNPRLAPGNKPLFAIEPTKHQAFFDALKTAQRLEGPAEGGGDVMLSRAGDAIDEAKKALTARNVVDRFQDLTRTSKVFGWWHHTVATQYHKAKVNPLFGAVYDKAQEYLHDTSAFANDPADMAPDLLPQLKTLGDLKRSLALKKADADALAKAVFGGTLNYLRDDSGQVREAGEGETAGVVFTPEELRSEFGFNDDQVKLYQQFRKATDRSLDILAAADVARLLGEGLPESMRAMISAGDVGRFKGIVSAFTMQMKDKAEADLAAVRKRHRNEMAAFWRKQKGLLEGPRGRAGARLALLEELEAEKNGLKFRQGGEKYRAEQEAKKWAELEQTVRGKYERIDQLKAQGYAPLMRFGRYTVDVTGADGGRQFFGMFETEREANAAARKFRDAAEEGDVVTQGIMSQEAYKQFSGLTPETIELFAEVAGVEKSALFEEYLRRAKNNRSALKRLIKRTGVAGFSEDSPRVLASFITSNARAASASMHLGALRNAVEEIPKEQGDVKDEAIKLREYVQNPQEEAQGIRSLLFAQYLGGSVASALVNMTQPFMMTFPYLSQFGGPAKAAARLGAALKTAAAGVDPASALGKALRLAEKEGIVEPQEIHQLQAEASRTVANSPLARRALFIWGGFFSLAERFNRRVSFIAAYNTAQANGMADPFKFAADSVAETQGVYNKGNRPNWARGAIGATVFTFKQYSISYMEFLKRLPPREKAIALAILLLAAGAQGLPGADDLDDLIDTLGQHMGYDTNAKAWKVKVLEQVLGEAGADFVLRGASAMPGVPLDVSGRLSLGNLVPGTGLLRKDKADKAGEVTEALGPFASLVASAFKAVPALVQGDVGKVNELMGPTATRNLGKAIGMWMTGEYRDQAGRKVTDVSKADAIVKGIGFQPAEVARDSRKASMVQQNIALAKTVEAEIASQWAQGIADQEPEQVAKARKRLENWNRDNPGSRIAINRSQIQKRVREMRLTRDERIAKRAPKSMRRDVAEALN